MFRAIAAFEARYQARSPIVWGSTILFSLLAFASSAVDRVSIFSGTAHKNAPYAITQLTITFSMLMMLVATAVVANVIVRDDETRFAPLIRTTRITKFQYLFGRFTGAVMVLLLAYLAVPFGAWIGANMPWVDAELIGVDRLANYISPYFAIALPNLLIISSLFFALATITRSMMASYLGVVGLIILWTLVAVSFDRNPDLELYGAYLEPFGAGAFNYVSRYWTTADRNVLTLPLDGVLLANRAIWLSLAAFALGSAYVLFRFSDRPAKVFPGSSAEPSFPIPAIARSIGTLPWPRFDLETAIAQFLARTRLETGQIVRSPAYLVLLLFAVFNAASSLIDLGQVFGTPVLPVTRVVLFFLEGSFRIMPFVIAIYYAGELVWSERDRKIFEVVDASAVPDWTLMLPKVVALVVVLVSTLCVGVATAVAMQFYHGYAHVEPAKYLLWYVLPLTIDFTLIAILSIFVQAICPHKFVGWGVMLLFLLTRITFHAVSLGDFLYNFGDHPQIKYSDMNGSGSFWIGAYWFRLYWSSFAALLLIAAYLLWRRGTATGLRARLRRVPIRLHGPAGLLAAIALLLFVSTGTFAYLNTHRWNDYRTPVADEQYQADMEKALLRYEAVPQPEVEALKIAVDIHPAARQLSVTGEMSLVNSTAAPIGELHLRMADRNTRLVSVTLGGAELARTYPQFGYRIYRLRHPLAPGATMTLGFKTDRGWRGFRNGGEDTRLVANGTFLNNYELAPSVGMDRRGLLQDPARRRQYDLAPNIRLAKLEDLRAAARNETGSSWTTTDITISTDPDQTPVAPGERVSDVTVKGRRTARFVTSSPIQNLWSVQSARYAERTQMHDGVALTVYYDPQHGGNVDRMLSALVRGLDYYKRSFGPYQFSYVRIVEFPDYAKFAQAYAGTIPYSEGVGFIADLRDSARLDYVTYVTTHELAHQWWGHQTSGGRVQGATMLTETFAQYSSLMVLEHLYGRDQMRRFLKYELDLYLRGRGNDPIGEQPLIRVENQQYVHYRKGSLAMYRLKDELGEKRVNAALARYLARYRFKGAPYPRTVDFLAELRRGASPAEQRLVSDLFERITIYDLKVQSARVSKRADGRFETLLTVDAHKLYADGSGREVEVPISETVEVGLFSAMPGYGRFAAADVIALQHSPLRSGRQIVRIVSDKAPLFAGVDPYNVRIDRNSDDNVAAISSDF